MSRPAPLIDLRQTPDVLKAVINIAGLGDNTIVAAVAGKIIRVHQFALVSTGINIIEWESGATGTPITGAMPLVANSILIAEWNPMGHFETAEGALLNLSLSAALGIDGWINYSLVEPNPY